MRKIIPKIRYIGPSALVTAAFIGPGTVTTASLAGARFGYQMLSVVVFSIFSAIILQLVIAHLTIHAQNGLTVVISEFFNKRFLKGFSVILILLAVLGGGLAYEMGNINGAALGIKILIPMDVKIIGMFVTGVAGVFLMVGSYRFLKRLLLLVVAVMSLSFVITAAIVRPEMSHVLRGFTNITFSTEMFPLLVALIGTTVVPYNFFLYSETLHTDSIRSNFSSVKLDIYTMMCVGGIITAAIIVTSAYQFFSKSERIITGIEMADQLRPLFGDLSRILFGTGFFAAGFSSTLTAPLAAYLVLRIICRKIKEGEKIAKYTSLLIIMFGGISLYSGLKPVTIILLAQITNGIILPFISIVILIMLFKYRRNIPLLLILLSFISIAVVIFSGLRLLFLS